jgi:hypothetical protein
VLPRRIGRIPVLSLQTDQMAGGCVAAERAQINLPVQNS